MSATFNWTYRPGVANKYGLVINASADDVRPSNAVYVALFGNDTTGNGSRKYPYRTVAKALTIGGAIILGSGVYRESVNSANLYADGDVIFDFFPSFGLGNGNGGVSRNIKFRYLVGGQIGNMQDVVVDGPGASTNLNVYSDVVLTRVIYSNHGVLDFRNSPAVGPYAGYNTFVNIANMRWNSANLAASIGGGMYYSIFDNCRITIYAQMDFDYSLFHNCQFKINGQANYTAIDNLADFLAFITAAYPTCTAFRHCIFADPKFNNPGIGDYTLALDSPARNASYFGTCIGAKSIAQPIKASATEADGGFEFASAVNVTIANDSITFTEPIIDAQIDTKPIVNLLGREISNLPSYGLNADRNGQYIDSIADLSTSVYNSGDTLPGSMPFIVEVGAIVYNGNTFQPGDRGTTVAGVTTFSTSEDGVIREIVEAPQRHTIMARFSNGGDSVAAGAALTDGHYYYVATGSVTYNAVEYTAGSVFKASGTTAFSGSGTVNVAFANEAFQHYEPGIQPTSNNVGDLRTGDIIRGNGDPAYVRGGLGVQEFPINQKFIQIRYFIRANNLKP